MNIIGLCIVILGMFALTIGIILKTYFKIISILEDVEENNEMIGKDYTLLSYKIDKLEHEVLTLDNKIRTDDKNFVL